MTEPLTAADIPAASMEQLRGELLELKRSGVGKDRAGAYVEAWMDGFGRPSLAGSFTQGLTGGFGDEIKGGLRALVGAGSGNRLTETARARGQLAASSQKNGWLATGAEVAGGVAPAVLGAGLATRAVPAAATGIGRAVQGLVGGAAGGAVTGAVYGSGNAIGGPEQRLEGARNAAIPGAVLGTVAAPVVQAGQAIGRKVLGAVFNRGAEANAGRNFNQAMQEAGTNPQRVATEVAKARVAGVPMTAAEGIGQPGQDLLDYAVNTPGPGRQLVKPAIEARQIAQPGRIREAVSRITGVDAGAATRELDAKAARSAVAGPAYDAMHGVQAPQPVMAALWSQLKDSPEWKRAYHSAANSSRLLASVGDIPRALPGLDDFMAGKQALTAHEVDAVLQAVQDQVKAGLVPGALPGAKTIAGGPGGSRALNKTSEHIAGLMEKTVPEFKVAREGWKAASDYLDGLKIGQKALEPNVTIDMFGQLMKRAGAEEKRGLREGLISAYKAKLEGFTRGPAADASREGLNVEAFREKFRIALGDNTANELMRQLEMESVTSRTANQIKNSATGFRGANKAAIEGEPLAGSDWSIGSIAKRVLGSLDEATSRKMRGQIGRIGMEMDPAEVERLLREAMIRNPNLVGGARTGALSGSTAALLTDRGR